MDPGKRFGALPAALCGIVAGLSLMSGSLVRASEECAACHEDLVKGFAASAHGRAFRYDPQSEGASCESCHGPGRRHVEAGGEAGTIANPAKLRGGEAADACLACHENRLLQAHWTGSQHEAAGVTCADCHAVHAASPPRRGRAVVRSTTELCVSCHVSQRKGLLQRSTHPLREEKMDCASCHNPHGSGAEHLLAADSVNDLCFTCHQEKRGPFLWEHAPVREDCLTCHAPHGSNHDRMLVARPVQLCQSCHLQGRHQTVAGLPTAMWNVNRQCLNCHPQIHGSNHPSGPLFQR